MSSRQSIPVGSLVSKWNVALVSAVQMGGPSTIVTVGIA
jgi:hypothetical protein